MLETMSFNSFKDAKSLHTFVSNDCISLT